MDNIFSPLSPQEMREYRNFARQKREDIRCYTYPDLPGVAAPVTAGVPLLFLGRILLYLFLLVLCLQKSNELKRSRKRQRSSLFSQLPIHFRCLGFHEGRAI